MLLELSRNKIDICAISESKRKGKGITPYQEYLLFFSGVPKESRAKEGVALAINRNLESLIDHHEYISERILVVSMKIDNSHLYIFSVYAPEDCKSKLEKEQFYDSLQENLSKIPPNNPILILGDLNARVGNDVVHGIKHRFNEGEYNDNGTIFVQLCADNELRINNTFFDHKIQHK